MNKDVYVVQYWEANTDFIWQIYTVTTSLDYAEDCTRYLESKPDVVMAGYETHKLIELEEIFEAN